MMHGIGKVGVMTAHIAAVLAAKGVKLLPGQSAEVIEQTT